MLGDSKGQIQQETNKKYNQEKKKKIKHPRKPCACEWSMHVEYACEKE